MKIRALAALPVVLVQAGGLARAEDPARRLNVLAFEPAPGGGLTVDDAAPVAGMGLRGGLFVGFAKDVLFSGGSNRPVYKAVEQQLVSDVTAAFGLWDLLELGVHLPVVLNQRGEAGVGSLAALGGAAVGDVRVVPKVRLFGDGDGLNLAVLTAFTVPTGTDDRNAGEKGMTFEPELAASWQFGPGTALRLNVGYKARPAVSFGRLIVDDAVTVAAGASARVASGFGLLAEVFGEIGVSEGTDDPERAVDWAERPFEAIGALTWTFDNGSALVAGGGGGLTQGWGAPAWRAFLGFSGTFDLRTMADADNDGVPDMRDACKSAREDDDGFEDGDGCPDLDDDRDGVPDASDGCDREPEDRDGFEDEDGCPERDNDRDGVEDTFDGCSLVAEDRDGFEDADGCPEDDNDGDGLPDVADKCPNEKEIVNGVSDDDGCPDESSVKLTGDRIELTEMIMFEPDKAVIVGASLKVVDHVAALMKASANIARVRVEGHTDAFGPPAYNLDLSQRRADAVVAALVARGVEASRLVAQGFGATRQVCQKLTADCQAKNRRTEFHVMPPGEPAAPAPAAPAPAAPAPAAPAPAAPAPVPAPAPAPAPPAPAPAPAPTP